MKSLEGGHIWQLDARMRLRQTPSGGAVFLRDSFTTIELDGEAVETARLLSTPRSAHELRTRLMVEFGRNFTLAEIDILLRQLAARGVVHQACPDATALPSRAEHHSRAAPESVHLQLNNVCNLSCPSCYVALQPEDRAFIPLDRIQELIGEWAEMGVFQLALGGGEPLLSPKLVPVVRYARERGLVPNVTTNGSLLTEELLAEVQGSLGEIRLSLNDSETVKLPQIEGKAQLLRSRGQRFGFNLIVTRRNLERLPALLSWACAQEAGTLNLIRPKPAPGNQAWYKENVLSVGAGARLGAILRDAEPLFTRTSLTVDCAFSFLFHGWPTEALRARCVAGCAMGERFATVKWNGDVFPCSHLRGEQFKAGNVMSRSFRDIWNDSEVFTIIRADLKNVTGKCGSCGHRALCKGCRAVMWQQSGDWLADDRDCPM